MTLPGKKFKAAIASTKLEKLIIHAMGWNYSNQGFSNFIVNKTFPGAVAMVQLLDGEIDFTVYGRLPEASLGEHIQIKANETNLFEYMVWYWVANWKNYNLTCVKHSYYNSLLQDIQSNWFERLEMLCRLYECPRLDTLRAWSVPDKEYEVITPTPDQT